MPVDSEQAGAAPDLSVVVNTFNRRDELETCLDSLLSQVTSATFEIIVVNDASTDGTDELLESLPVTALRAPTNEGLALGRNRGASAARSQLIAFLDDDELVEPTWVDKVLAAWSDVPSDVKVVCTTPTPFPGKSFNRRYLRWQNPLVPIGLLPPGKLPLTERIRRYLQRINGLPPHGAHIGYAPGGSITIRAEAFWKIGGYQPHNFAAGEDDYFCEALRGEFGESCIAHASSLGLFHNFKPGFRDSMNRNFRYGKGHGELFRHAGSAPVLQPLPALLIPLGLGSALLVGWWSVLIVVAVPYLITLPHLLRSARSSGPLILTFPPVMALLEFFDWAGFASALFSRQAARPMNETAP